MVTWNDAAPPDLAEATPAQKLRGALRVVGVLAVTALALGLFLIGKWLRARVSRRIGFHFVVAKLWSRIMLRLMGARLTIRGEPIRGGGVIVSNHASWADILALRATRRLNFVSKAEVRAWPGVGWIAETCGTVFIERRRAATMTQRDLLRARLDRGETLCLFPEGTSSDGLRVLPFKSALLSFLYEDGVRETARVQAATVNWTAPPGQPPAFYGWWGNMPFEGHIWDVVCRAAGGAVEVVFSEPARVSDFPDRKAMAQTLEAQVRAAKR